MAHDSGTGPCAGDSTHLIECDASCRLQKLPLELLYHIIRLAASADYKTAHACAYVSKAVCRWTAPDRWRTIVCTDVDQVEALWEVLEARRSSPKKWFTSLPSRQPGSFVENLFIETGSSSQPDSSAASSGIEARTRTLLDLQAKHQQMDVCRTVSCPRLDAQNMLIDGVGHQPHRVYDLLRHFPHVNYLALGPVETTLFRIDSISPTKVLCTSTGDHAMKKITYTVPHSVNHSRNAPHIDHEALWRADGSAVWRPSMEAFRRRLKSVHFICMDPQSELSGITMPIKEIEALRSGSFSLESFLRQMADHELGGLPPRLDQNAQQEALASRWHPWPADDQKGRRRYARGSDPVASASAEVLSEGDDVAPHDEDTTTIDLDPFQNEYSRIRPSFWTEFEQGVTRIRYDTRKFAFRPCEITASRLKPFFEELTTTGGDLATSIDTDLENPSASFKHSGPRHAAPHRGAGHFSKPDLGGQHRSRASTAKQAALDTFGCNRFQQLHLCWDPVPGADKVQDQTSDGPAALAKLSMNSGSDWPVERQDIWTNTSSTHNEAQAPPPHTSAASLRGHNNATRNNAVQAQPSSEAARTPRQSWLIPSALESKQSKAFRADLIDSIRTTFGWTRQDQQLLSDTPWLSHGSNLDRRLDGEARRNRLENLVSEMAFQQTPAYSEHDTAHASRGITSDEKLTIRLVPPAERLKLGGMYVPYTKSQRVRWFLDNLDTDDA